VTGGAGAATVFLVALATAAATGLGALPLLFSPRPSPTWLALANALAAGAMGGASIGLLQEASSDSARRAAVGAVLGVGAMALTKRFLVRGRDVHVGSFGGLAARAMVLIVVVMTVHSFAEGIGVGVAFGGGEAFGLVIALAIAIHNIPEGLAISLVLVPRGVTVGRAAAWSVFSSLPQPVMAVPAFLFVEAFEELLPAGLGFAAGAMLWMVGSELLPEALRVRRLRAAVLGLAFVAAAAMVALQAALV
jgi:zinc transporter ZupT